MVFYQFSSQEKHRSKIKQTIQRLKSFGREPKALIYVTSINIPNIDNEELDLSEELNVNIKIRDSKYIISHINDNTGTQAAYTNHLSSHTAYLKQVGASRTIPKSQHAIDPSVYVFLQQEVENRFGKTNLLETITDTLIIWALNETDPDKGIFLSREEVLDKILATIPWSKQFIKAHLDRRLGLLRSKNGVDGREITLHGASKKYCLPYKTRHGLHPLC